MHETPDAHQRAQTLRQETLGILDDLTEATGSFELPAPPPRLTELRRRLDENTYDVVVVGEAKRGKSSFVNALIGQNVLPTDVEVATSQAFKVRRAEGEAYRLRFEDGSEQPISRDELARHGSQVVADQQGSPRLDQTLRWIEVDVPVRFLPEGVHLVDTPGLGSLYAAHAEVTYRFVPTADAVIFVLDSEQPILRSELDVLGTLLEVTPDIFFIQTKIDLYATERWQELLGRNEEILRAELGERLTDPRIWPISSTLLGRAASQQTSEEMYLRISHHQPLAAALQAFLLRVAGWRRTTEAALLARHAQGLSLRTLGERVSAVAQESQEARSRTQRQLAERKQQFESQWGERGSRRRELLESLDAIASAARQSFSQELQLAGRIGTLEEDAIRGVGSLDEAKELGEGLSQRVASAVMRSWQQTCQQVYTRCVALLAPFQSAADELLAPQDSAASSGLVIREGTSIELEGLWWRKARGGYLEAAQASGLAGMVGTVATVVFPPAWPFAAVSVLAAGLWGWWKGRKRIETEELESARRRLREHLADTLQRLRNHLLGVDNADFASGRLKSRVDQHLLELRRQVLEHVDRMVEQKSQEARAELERLTETAQLEERQRKERAEQLRGHIAMFEAIGRRLSTVEEGLAGLAAAGLPKEEFAS